MLAFSLLFAIVCEFIAFLSSVKANGDMTSAATLICVFTSMGSILSITFAVVLLLFRKKKNVDPSVQITRPSYLITLDKIALVCELLGFIYAKLKIIAKITMEN
ncbi:TPA: hypothetical protein ACKFQ2_004440 [Citrobacter amalonaticus]